MPPREQHHWVTEAMGEPRLSDPQGLTDLLNYQLHLILGFSSAPIVRLCENEFGITLHEWGYVGLLAAFGPIAPSELALRSGMDRSRTSKALMPLVAKGLVERRSVPGDGRRATVALTAQGRRLYQRLFARACAVHGQLLDGFQPSERTDLARLLARLRARAVELATRVEPWSRTPGRHPR